MAKAYVAESELSFLDIVFSLIRVQICTGPYADFVLADAGDLSGQKRNFEFLQKMFGFVSEE